MLFMARNFHWPPSEMLDLDVNDMLTFYREGVSLLKAENEH